MAFEMIEIFKFAKGHGFGNLIPKMLASAFNSIYKLQWGFYLQGEWLKYLL